MKRGANPLVLAAAALSLGWSISVVSVFAGWRGLLRKQAVERIGDQSILIARGLRSCLDRPGTRCDFSESTLVETTSGMRCQIRTIPDSLRLLPDGDPPAERYLVREAGRFLVSERSISTGRAVQLRRPLSSISLPRMASSLAAALGVLGALFPFLLLAGLLHRERRRTSYLIEVARCADQGHPIPDTPPGVPGDESALVSSLGSDLRRRRILSRWEERRLARLLDSLSEGVLLLDSRLRVLVCNVPAADALDMRQAKASVRGRPIVSLTPNLEFLDDLRKSVARSAASSFDVNHQSRVFATRVWPVPADPESGGWLVSLRDVTSQRRAENLQSRLVSDASHEFKTPLTSIRGWTETLLEDEEDEFRRKALERVAQGTRHLEEVVRDLLDLGRIAETNTQIRYPVALEAVCAEAISSLEGEADRKQVRLELHASTSAQVMGYRGQLVRAVINLLSNAIRYTPVGSRVAISIQEGSESSWTIDVSDHGPGIPPESIPHLFERFYRADHGRSRDLGGTGLGLAIVQDTARAHGGHAEVESLLGVGSVFRIVLAKSIEESSKF
jgi:two-component system phosphate regulon sensor histidine kinase PhoR